MPFTPSHAVVALPFVRTPLIPAAIAIGAMTPDLPLFVRTGLPLYGITHSASALPVTVAVALVLLLVWRCVLRPAAGELSPRWVAERLPASWSAGPRGALRETFADARDRITVPSVVLLVVSLLFGVITHIVWDLFTHEGRWGVALFPALADTWGPMIGYKWLQHGSSVIGLVIIGIWAAVWIGRRDASEVHRMLPSAVRAVWWLSLPLVLVSAWAVGLVTYGPITPEWTIQHLAYRVLPAAAGAWGAATLVLAAVVTVIRSRSAESRGSTTG
ncbi:MULTISPECIES: DUF4184 family protein [unclassified Microbacterium]|uniref:DUF4184 family protein n=1 Tax=unclassified Microbacterium TaxID=2609290 RepID=UPI000D587188|nr:DUF4184 family protein [Microbacterium sp. Gd 4-13]PVW04557.1 DUF4184 domain-containing protein [Microbacterium sp. Gd 4-13]